MIKVSYNQAHNAVIMEFSGTITVPQTEKLLKEIAQTLPKNCKGFKLLTDLTEVCGVDPNIKTNIQKLMDYLNEHGVKEILRVIPDPAQDIGLNIMSAFHYSKDVQFATLQTREEAEARL